MTEIEEPIDMKVGDIFLWKETETYWLVYLRYIEENAYFRAEIRKCSSVLDIDGKKYRAYIRGPVETQIKWNVKDIAWNSLNYSKIAYVKEDEITSSLGRLDKVLVDELPFEIQAINKDTASDGIMILYLAEDYKNTIEDEAQQIVEKIPKEEIVSEINGRTEVYPFEIERYEINASGGEWKISNPKKAQILEQKDSSIQVEFITGRAGSVDIIYIKDGKEYILPVEIKSL